MKLGRLMVLRSGRSDGRLSWGQGLAILNELSDKVLTFCLRVSLELELLRVARKGAYQHRSVGDLLNPLVTDQTAEQVKTHLFTQSLQIQSLQLVQVLQLVEPLYPFIR